MLLWKAVLFSLYYCLLKGVPVFSCDGILSLAALDSYVT
jgi:hypothetical protein